MKSVCLTLLFPALFSGFPSIAQDTTLAISISNSLDDAEQEGNLVDLADLELDLGKTMGVESMIGVHFRNIPLEPTTIITSTVLRFVAQASLTDTLHVDIFLEQHAFPKSFNDSTVLDMDRVYFNDKIAWAIPPVEAGDTLYSPDLSTLTNAATQLSTWVPGSGFNFLIRPSTDIPDTINLEAQLYSFDQNIPGRRPALKLIVDTSNINGIEQVKIKTSPMVLYPNPARFNLMLKSVHEKGLIQIYDVLGQLVLQATKYRETSVLNVAHLTTGCYTLLFTTETGVEHAVFFKE